MPKCFFWEVLGSSIIQMYYLDIFSSLDGIAMLWYDIMVYYAIALFFLRGGKLIKCTISTSFPVQMISLWCDMMSWCYHINVAGEIILLAGGVFFPVEWNEPCFVVHLQLTGSPVIPSWIRLCTKCLGKPLKWWTRRRKAGWPQYKH